MSDRVWLVHATLDGLDEYGTRMLTLGRLGQVGSFPNCRSNKAAADTSPQDHTNDRAPRRAEGSGSLQKHWRG